MIDKNSRPIVKECYSDSGTHSHWKLIDIETGKTLWEEAEDDSTPAVRQLKKEVAKIEQKYASYISNEGVSEIRAELRQLLADKP